MADLRQLGYEISKARDRNGLTQEELGEYLGISRSAVSLLEGGRTKYPKLSQLAAIAQRLDIDPTVLYDLAGATLTSDQIASSQLAWLTEGLDAANLRRLIAIGHALLQEQLDSQGKAGRSSSPRSR